MRLTQHFANALNEDPDRPGRPKPYHFTGHEPAEGEHVIFRGLHLGDEVKHVPDWDGKTWPMPSPMPMRTEHTSPHPEAVISKLREHGEKLRQRHELDPHNDRLNHLGFHWTTDPSMAHQFAFDSSHGRYRGGRKSDKPSLGAILEVHTTEAPTTKFSEYGESEIDHLPSRKHITRAWLHIHRLDPDLTRKSPFGPGDDVPVMLHHQDTHLSTTPIDLSDSRSVIRRQGGMSEHDSKNLAFPGDHPDPTYVRFGDWPEDERSTNWAIGHKEDGVSVYELNKHGNPIDPDGDLSRDIHHHEDHGCEKYDESMTGHEQWDCGKKDGEWDPDGERGNDTGGEMRDRVRKAERVFANGVWDARNARGHLVKGDLVSFGHDDEPLLHNVRRVGDWVAHRHHFVPTAEPHPLLAHHTAEDEAERKEYHDSDFGDDHEEVPKVLEKTAAYDKHKVIQHREEMRAHLIEHHPEIIAARPDADPTLLDSMHRASHQDEGRGLGKGEPNLLAGLGHDHHPLIDPSLPKFKRLSSLGSFGEQDWKEVYDDVPDEVHRGLGVGLPDDLHRFVHDESKPVHERAKALLRHVTDSSSRHMIDYSDNSLHRDFRSGLGTSWSGDQDVAEDFSRRNADVFTDHHQRHAEKHEDKTWGHYMEPHEDGAYPVHVGKPGTAVVLHAHKPELHEIDDNLNGDGSGVRYTYHGHGEQEVPVHGGTSMRIKGISWRPVLPMEHPGYVEDPETYTRHDFDQPQHHEALLRYAEHDWRGMHQAPGPDNPAIHEITENSDMLEHPEYYHAPVGPASKYHCSIEHQYARDTWKGALEGVAAAKQVQGKPEAPVTIYRSAPHHVEHIHSGDWVTTSPRYAQRHAESNLENGSWKILKATVPAKHVNWDQGDANEYGYNGPDIEHAEEHTHRHPELPYHSEDDFQHHGSARFAASDYVGQHSAPGPDDAPLHDLTQAVPADIYTHPHHYIVGPKGDSYTRSEWASHGVAARVRDKPDAQVTVYRAVPHHVHDINSGDWVTVEPSYAKAHAAQSDDPKDDWKILKAKTKAKHVNWDANSLSEWGYNGPDVKEAPVHHPGGKRAQEEYSRSQDAMKRGKSDYWPNRVKEGLRVYQSHSVELPQHLHDLTRDPNTSRQDKVQAITQHLHDKKPYWMGHPTWHDDIHEALGNPHGETSPRHTLVTLRHTVGSTDEIHGGDGHEVWLKPGVQMNHRRIDLHDHKGYSLGGAEVDHSLPSKISARDLLSGLGITTGSLLPLDSQQDQVDPGRLSLEGGRHGEGQADLVGGHPRGGPGLGQPRGAGRVARPLRRLLRAGAASGDDETAGPRSLTYHPKFEKDMKSLDKPVQKQVRAALEGLARGDESVMAQTHALVGPLKGWSATKVSRGHRIVHQPNEDGGIHIGGVNLHEYDDLIRRLT